MLSLDQFLRPLTLPAVVAAFLIASHVSTAVSAPPAPAEIAREQPFVLIGSEAPRE
jgi:hypothetical protein